MQVALVTPGFPADEQDSGCIPALQDYVRGLAAQRRDWRLRVFSLHYPNHDRPYRWHGVEVVPIGGRNRGLPISVLNRMRLLSALRRAGPVDLLHAFWLGECAGVAARIGVPLVVTLMGQEVRQRNRWYRLLQRPGVRSVAVSDYQRQILAATGGPDVARVIPWGVGMLAPQPDEPRDIDVLGVGNLIPVKDPLRFIQVVAALVVHHPRLRACWAGGGPMLAQARALAREVGIAGNLHFTDAIPRPQVLAMMARSRVLLHTAEFESFAMVMAEARALGAAIVSRPVGIAASGTEPGIHLAETVAGLTDAVLSALSAPLPPPARPWPLEQSVDAYVRLYQELAGC